MEKDGNYAGIFIDWSVEENVVQRSFDIEVPGKATQAQEDYITAGLFDFFMETFFETVAAEGLEPPTSRM